MTGSRSYKPKARLVSTVVARVDTDRLDDFAVLLGEYQREVEALAGYVGFEPDTELTRERLDAMLSMPDYGAFIAQTPKGHLLGFCALFPMPVGLREERFAILDRLYVRPEFRRSGVARQLVAEAKRFAKSCKCQRLQATLPAAFPLDSAEAFFDAEKFYRTGGRKHKIALG